LSVIPIHVPSLSERLEDIPLLADHFIQQVCTEQGIAPKKIADKAVKELQKLPWTGNVRELRNVIERLVILSGKEITEADVKAYAIEDRGTALQGWMEVPDPRLGPVLLPAQGLDRGLQELWQDFHLGLRAGHRAEWLVHLEPCIGRGYPIHGPPVRSKGTAPTPQAFSRPFAITGLRAWTS
jgi:DNA-binding NtrC family response regulator